MTIKVYEYSKCSTCQKALRFLDKQKLKYQAIPIVEKPPSIQELKKMLGYIKARGGTLRNLFNTSGILYRELKLSEKLNTLSESEALQILSKQGMLVKRPFVLLENDGLLGFKVDEWKKYF